jgi:GDP-4-dehydro-6-deoxy-D-mannose reductase
MAETAARSRILITGGTGFVGPHLVRALRARFGGAPDVVAASVDAAAAPEGASPAMLDVTDRAAVEAAIARLKPTAVFHLAGATHVQTAAQDPFAAWTVNLQGTLNLIEAVMKAAPEASFIHVSTGEVYGLSANRFDRLDEDAPMQPSNQYAASKAAADLAVGEAALRGLKAVRFRPFNHTGPGQSPAFVAPGLASQIAQAEHEGRPAVLRVGLTDRARDFLDVRDVVEAYVLALARIAELPAGVAMNLASGRARTIGSLIEGLTALARQPVSIEQEASRVRTNDVETITGAADRARSLLGWTPRIAFEQTLADLLQDCRERAAA